MIFPKRDTLKKENFFRIKDGETKTGVIRGSRPYGFYQSWATGRPEIVERGTEGAVFRYRLNIIIKDELSGELVAKIWEVSPTLCNQLADLNEEFPLEKTKIKITRRGSERDTVYTIVPCLKEPLTPGRLKDIEAVPLNILEHQEPPKEGKSHVRAVGSAPDFGDEPPPITDEIPF